MTITELNDHVSEGITDSDKRAMNFAFLKRIHGNLKEGGMWGWPDGQEIYRKAGDGFELEVKYAD